MHVSKCINALSKRIINPQWKVSNSLTQENYTMICPKKSEKTELCSIALATITGVCLPNPKFPQPTFFNTLFPHPRNQDK